MMHVMIKGIVSYERELLPELLLTAHLSPQPANNEGQVQLSSKCSAGFCPSSCAVAGGTSRSKLAEQDVCGAIGTWALELILQA